MSKRTSLVACVITRRIEFILCTSSYVLLESNRKSGNIAKKYNRRYNKSIYISYRHESEGDRAHPIWLITEFNKHIKIKCHKVAIEDACLKRSILHVLQTFFSFCHKKSQQIEQIPSAEQQNTQYKVVLRHFKSSNPYFWRMDLLQ